MCLCFWWAQCAVRERIGQWSVGRYLREVSAHAIIFDFRLGFLLLTVYTLASSIVMLVPSLAILIAAAACLPAAHAAPFPLSALLSRQAGDGKPAFTKIPFHRVRHDGRSNEKRQIAQGLQANQFYV